MKQTEGSIGLFLAPGRTLGLQVVRVNTAKGPAVVPPDGPADRRGGQGKRMLRRLLGERQREPLSSALKHDDDGQQQQRR